MGRTIEEPGPGIHVTYRIWGLVGGRITQLGGPEVGINPSTRIERKGLEAALPVKSSSYPP